MGTPIPPNYYYPQVPHYMDYSGPAAQPVDMTNAAFEQALDEAANKAKAKTKKGKTGKQDETGETKKRAPVETRYEAYTLQRLAPNNGDAKTWSKVGKLQSPFDSTRVYKEAMAHKQRTGVDASRMYDSLLTNQQGVIDRILEEKRLAEKHPDAVWTLFDVYKVKQDTPVGLFRTARETLKLVVTIRCQDKSKTSYNDKPPGSTVIPGKFVGEVIDLSLPLKAPKKDGKGDHDGKDDDGGTGKGNKKKKGKKNNNEDDADIIEEIPGTWPDPFNIPHAQNNAGHHGHEQQPQQAQHNEPWPNYVPGQQQDNHNHNGYDNQQQWPQNGHYGGNNNNNYYNQGAHGYHNQNIPPHAPMAPNPLDNPFLPMPQVGPPEQFMQPIDNQPYNDYSARRYSRSRSRNHSRHPSRHRSGDYHQRQYRTPSLGSSRDDDWGTYGSSDSFSPPRTPDSFGDPRLHRRGSRSGRQVYVREGRTLYPGEGGIYVMPASEKRDTHVLPILTRRRPQIVYDDHPASRHAIANYPAEYYEEAEFNRRGRRREAVDFARNPITGRNGRHDDLYRARRYSYGH